MLYKEVKHSHGYIFDLKKYREFCFGVILINQFELGESFKFQVEQVSGILNSKIDYITFRNGNITSIKLLQERSKLLKSFSNCLYIRHYNKITDIDSSYT